MTNLEYLQDEATNVELFRLTNMFTFQDCDVNDLDDYANHMVNRDRLFKGSFEDIAKRFIFTIYLKDEVVDYQGDANAKMYITQLFKHDIISDNYYDMKYATPYDEILDLVKTYLNAEYQNNSDVY